MSDDAIYKNPIYQALVAAIRAQDHGLEAALIEEGIASSHGKEREAWIRLRWGRRWSMRSSAEGYQTSWDELWAALLGAPDDFRTQLDALTMNVSVASVYECLNGLGKVVAVVRPNLSRLLGGWVLRQSLGLILLKRREWARSGAMLDRALDAFFARLPEQVEAHRGYLVFLYSRAAVAAMRSGNLEKARLRVEQAVATDQTFPRLYLDPGSLTTAHAELALFQGQVSAAMTTLQDGQNRYQEAKRPVPPYFQVEFDLLAARLARARRNEAAFLHFGQRALGVCLQNNLPWSERTVQAILAGADY